MTALEIEREEESEAIRLRTRAGWKADRAHGAWAGDGAGTAVFSVVGAASASVAARRRGARGCCSSTIRQSLSAASREALERALAEAGFVLEVTRVVSIDEEVEIRQWDGRDASRAAIVPDAPRRVAASVARWRAAHPRRRGGPVSPNGHGAGQEEP